MIRDIKWKEWEWRENDIQVWSVSLIATYVKLHGSLTSEILFAGSVMDKLPIPTCWFVSRSEITALMWFKCRGRKLLPVSTLRSSLAGKEKLVGEREKIISGGAVPFRSGLSENQVTAGTRGIVKASTTARLEG